MLKARVGTDFDRVVHRVLPFLKRVRLHPDLITLAGVGASGVAAALFVADRWVLAGLAMLGAGFCDLVDGVIARTQGRSSRAGAFFDASMDRVSDLLVFGGIAVALAARADAAGTALACWALGAAVMTSYVRARAERELDSLTEGFMERGERWVAIVLGALTGFLHVALWVVAIGATATTVQRLVAARRRIAALENEGPLKEVS